MTRSERGGHLFQGTSVEPVRVEEECCASAPKTVAGNSHLTGEEASPSSPEVWRFCAAGEVVVAAEAAECLLIPGCEADCRLPKTVGQA